MGEDTSRMVRPGTNQAGMRAFNERLVLSLVRQHGALAKSEIARMTALSVQTVAVIMRQLEADLLLKRHDPVRGRVGQPSVPFSLNPDGAFFIGCKIGRRSLETLLVDFSGAVRHHTHHQHDFPDPETVLSRIQGDVDACTDILGEDAGRIAGVGISMPFSIWEWTETLGAPAERMQRWRDVDIRADLDEMLPYPVYQQNDATAACGAELAFGGKTDLSDFIHFYIGTFIGGGIVLGGGLYSGPTGNAGALGSCPVPDDQGRSVQLIDRASLILLERRLRETGASSMPLYDPDADWSNLGQPLDDWIKMAAKGIAHAIWTALAVLDFEAVVIDGAFPEAIHSRIVDQVRKEVDLLDLSGLARPEIRAGTVGIMARALGGASLPLFDRFLLDQRTLSNAGPARPR